MNKLVQATATAVAVLVAGLSSSQAQAVTFTQVGDTGQTLGTAQVIPAGSLPLESISGTVSAPNIAHLFKIFLTGGQTFSATTINAETLLQLPVDQALGIPTDLLVDPQLFLFDAAGIGVYGNDDSVGTQATLPSGGFSPAQSGAYFLAIAASGYNPGNTLGSIFSPANASGLFEPTGSGAANAFSSFTGQAESGGRYMISLTGVTTGDDSNSNAVPEPEQTAGLIAAGVLGIGYQLKKRKHQKSLKRISGLPLQ
ncbi:hypothetical protein JOY44_10195 [Phormidium sp. CLA17]|uniref:hypothetical protein n=1 Tax=Leptolyngbya sp. Cla-17 TaxID=2803751 RepID=UPI0014913395|nr:hypothetical protein [Leptolyngbya sp. Cla-17]MBM0741991.1 hypothetical protein [Leptolyngbya sp. Cla-17]